MIRTQISLEAEQLDRVRREAARQGLSVAGLIREALDDRLARDERDAVRERAKAGVGGFRSGGANVGEEHDDVLAEGRRW